MPPHPTPGITDASLLPTPQPLRSRLGLIGLIVLMLVAGQALQTVAGPPRLPAGLPSPDQLRALLTGSSLPLDGLAYALVSLAWLVWLWIVGSLALEGLVQGAEAVAHGTVWVRSLRRLADRLTLPLARRAVAAAFAVQVLSRGVPIAAAQPLEATELSFVVQADQARGPVFAQANSDTATGDHIAAAQPSVYTVRSGDTLWSIAQSAYGSGTEYRRIVTANLGRRMPDGQLFTARGVIQPGWELQLPPAGRAIEEVDGQRWYTVQAGDTLCGIAARVLDDEDRWADLFALNRDRPSTDGTHVLRNPNVIWPGLRLQLPAGAGAVADSAAAAAPADAAAPPEGPAAPAPVVASAEPAELTTAAEPSPEPSPAETLTAASSATLAGAVIAPIEQSPPPLLRSTQPIEPVSLDAPAEPPAAPSAEPTPAEPPSAAAPTAAAPAALGDLAMPLAFGGAAIVTLAGAAVGLGLRRRRRLKPLPHEPESEVVVEGGYAAAELTPEFARGLQGDDFDPVRAIVAHLRAFLDEYGITGASVVAVRHGRSSTTLTLAAGLAEQGLLLDLAPVFAARIDAVAEAWVSSDQDVLLRLARSRKPPLPPAGPADRSLDRLFVPLGALADRQVLSGAWPALGHVLVASLPGQGADVILTSLLASVTARCAPDALRVWLVAEPRALPAPVSELPHVERTIDPSDSHALAALVEDLRHELDRRASRSRPRDELVIVVPELTTLGEQAAPLELLVAPAAALGVRFLAAVTAPIERVDAALAAHFTSRMVLHLDDEEDSIGLLGVADAAFLGGGGRLLLRLDSREPVELFGFQVEPEHLERLVRLMRSAYAAAPSPSAPSAPAAAADHDDGAAAAATAETSDAATDETADQHDRSAAEAAPGPAPAPVLLAAPPDATPPLEAAAPLEAPADPSPDPPPARPVLSAVEPVVPPIQVFCFGAPRVVCAGQPVWPRQPAGDAKPWEFLLYLACQPMEGVARERAVTALWPDAQPEADATHRFRQLRYRLRTIMSTVPGAPPSEGIAIERGGPLRLDPTIIHSDAQAFLQLVRLARLEPEPARAMPLFERARLLFVGDLFDGPDVRRYVWADERDAGGITLREHFRRLFVQATVSLAGLRLETDQLDSALELYREASELEPTDERIWHSLFRIHARRGDRPALVREERRLRAALREVLDDPDDTSAQAEPSRALSVEFQHLLAELEARDRQPATV